MAVDFSDERETSAGPLDIDKNAGTDDDGIIDAPETGSDEPLDGGASSDPTENSADINSEAEILRQKNPLGYTVTPPTEAEIEEGKP